MAFRSELTLNSPWTILPPFLKCMGGTNPATIELSWALPSHHSPIVSGYSSPLTHNHYGRMATTLPSTQSPLSPQYLLLLLKQNLTHNTNSPPFKCLNALPLQPLTPHIVETHPPIGLLRWPTPTLPPAQVANVGSASMAVQTDAGGSSNRQCVGMASSSRVNSDLGSWGILSTVSHLLKAVVNDVIGV